MRKMKLKQDGYRKQHTNNYRDCLAIERIYMVQKNNVRLPRYGLYRCKMWMSVLGIRLRDIQIRTFFSKEFHLVQIWVLLECRHVLIRISFRSDFLIGSTFFLQWTMSRFVNKKHFKCLYFLVYVNKKMWKQNNKIRP